LMIPGFFLTILSTEYLPTIQISFQYVANWGAYMFPASVIALAAFPDTLEGNQRRRAAIAAMLLGSVVANYQWGAYSPRWTMRGGFVNVPLQRPTEADRIQPHTTGVHINNFPLRFGPRDCEYLLWSELSGDLGNEHGRAGLASSAYSVVEQQADVTLAQRRDRP
jgi:hypothetical protein